MKWTYLLIDFFTIIIPFIFSFHPKLQFYKKFGAFIRANIIVGILFILWDAWFTQMGIWGFNPTYLTGLNILNLPIEEALFFLCIPFSCVFTYHSLKLFRASKLPSKTEKLVVLVVSIAFLLVGLLFYSRLYTSFTFIGLAAALLSLKFIFNVNWLRHFSFSYLILLIPFFIVNGILTGTGLENPVVWYDNTHNLGIRLMTIPVEDIFYGALLILLNIFFYESFNTSKEFKTTTIY
jgi:lycopene cyclase domain-containing protein